MRVNWFSPLPPAKTDIAHYTGRILPELCSQADVTLWTHQREWDQWLDGYTSVRWFDPDHLGSQDINRADMSFYNLGNDARFHLGIWQVSRTYPGIVILHDIRLFDFFAYAYREAWRDRNGFIGEVEHYYGARSRADAEQWWQGRLSTLYMVEHYPLTPLATKGALAVVAHTKEAVDIVKDQTRSSLAYCSLPYRATPRSLNGNTRDSSSRTPPYRLILFGYIHLNRRLEQVLVALAEMPEKTLFRLDIFGQLWDPTYVTERVDALGLKNLVSIHGFVAEEDLDAALDVADLALNLRYPTVGEASGAQLRIWDHALPSLVTRVGMYASLPEDVVAFVRVEHEVADIQANLRAFLADPARFAQMGERGRRILEQDHNPMPYVKRLVGIADSARAVRRNAAAMQLAARVGSEMGDWCHPEHADAYYRRIAEEIRPLLI